MMLGKFWIVFGPFRMWKWLADPDSIYLWEIYTPFVRLTWLAKPGFRKKFLKSLRKAENEKPL